MPQWFLIKARKWAHILHLLKTFERHVKLNVLYIYLDIKCWNGRFINLASHFPEKLPPKLVVLLLSATDHKLRYIISQYLDPTLGKKAGESKIMLVEQTEKKRIKEDKAVIDIHKGLLFIKNKNKQECQWSL